MADVNQYRRADGTTQAAYAGSPLDERLSADETWALLGEDGEPIEEPATSERVAKVAPHVPRRYRHEDGREQGVFVGSELDKLLAQDPAWVPVDRLDKVRHPDPDPVPDPGAGPGPEVEGEETVTLSRGALEHLKRAQLDTLAAEHGVDEPSKLENKEAVIDAILASIEPQEPEGGDA